MNFDPLAFIIFCLPLLLAIPLHEAAHGFVAHRCGDPTAYNEGRVTFNPFKHIDLIGTIALPVVLILSGAPFIFGWAKPVPVQFALLNKPRRDMVLVAAAGPLTNLFLALISAIALKFAIADLPEQITTTLPWHVRMLDFSVILNVALAVFNLIPLLPLDGGRILAGILPPKLAIPFSRTEKFGFPVLLLLLIVVPLAGNFLEQNWSVFNLFLVPPMMSIINAIFVLVGIG
ncbi:MAG: site-2 protease family protein [Alphaproteobacteria bacterium]|nr:site-2 protease family protein [Alphaproteobacteria bacterium]